MTAVRQKLDVTLCKVAMAYTTVRVSVMADVNMTTQAMRNIAGTKASTHVRDNPDDVEWGEWDEFDIGETDMSRVQGCELAQPPRAPDIAYLRVLDQLTALVSKSDDWRVLDPQRQATLREGWTWLHSELPHLSVAETTMFDTLTTRLRDMNAPAFAVEVLA